MRGVVLEICGKGEMIKLWSYDGCALTPNIF